RGNCDLLVLLLVLAALGLLAGTTAWQPFAASSCLALAFYVKPYAGLLLLGLLSARRRGVIVYLILAAILIGGADVKGIVQFVQNLSTDIQAYDITFHWSAHPLSTYWPHLWEGTRLSFLSRLPGTAAAIFVLLPLAFWASYRIYQCPNQRGLLYPYFC